MTSAYEAGKQLHAEMVRRPPMSQDSDVFGSEIQPLSWENVFGRLWTRPGLSRRDRSLITIAVLSTLRAEDELRLHFQIARRNGLSVAELEEVVYHLTGYAGFPAAATARRVAQEALADFDESELS